MPRAISSNAIGGLTRDLTTLTREVKRMKEAIKTNTAEFKKINNKIERQEELEARNKPNWQHVPDITEHDRYPLVQDSQPTPEVEMDLTLKKLNIL
jgi:hypothetical protein